LTIANFTARDLAATPAAFTLLGLFVVVPGYVLGALTNLFDFHRRSLPARFAIALCLSLAVVPIATYFNWRYMPGAPWALCAATWLVFPVLVLRDVRRRNAVHPPLSRERKIVLALMGGWLVVGTLTLVDMQIGYRLYFHLASFDYTLRDSFTAAIARTGVPPTNPYYYPGHACPMRYHYFWFMLCALVARLSGGIVTPRIAVIAGTLWSGIALIAMVSLYTQIFGAVGDQRRDRRMLLAVGLLGVTGLDIVPTAITLLLSGRPLASSEWWNEPVLSWVNSTVWQPHSVAALVACATGLLAAWTSAQRQDAMRWVGAGICAFAFASACGLSIYVAAVFGLFLVVWAITLFLRGQWPAASIHAVAAVAALLLSLPYLLALLAGSPHGGPAPISFAVRRFFFAESFASPAAPHWHVAFADLLLLPLNYFLEFGFFFLAGVAFFRRLRIRGRLSDEDAFEIVMLATSLIVCSFLQSNAIANNDLGWRGILLAQFILLLWAARLWDDGLFPKHRKWRSAAGVLLILGAVPALYDLTMLRAYPVLLDELAIPRYHWLAPDHKLGERTYALRASYEALDKILPASAIVQQNPNMNPGDMFYGLYANRQTAAEGLSCGAVFGGPQALCAATLAGIEPLFSSSAHLSYAQVETICRDNSIAAVVVKDTDSAWRDSDSWIWKARPAIANAYSRAFLCAPPALTAKK
jgi:hypothetical protein